MDIDIDDEEYANTVNVTPFFWELISNIVTMDYETVKKTPSFKRLVECMVDDELRYSLTIGEREVSFDNVNELFYGTLRYCKQYEIGNVLLLENAIKKMEVFVATDDMASLFTTSLHLK
jgi:hypothetical protein